MLTCWWCQRKRQGNTKVSRIHPLATMNVSIAIHPVVVKKCHREPKVVNDPTDRHCHPMGHTTGMAKSRSNTAEDAPKCTNPQIHTVPSPPEALY